MAIYVGMVIFSDFNAVRTSIAKLGISGWGVILGLSLVNYCLRAVRWELYLKKLGYHLPSLLSLAYYLGGFAFTTTPGKAGETIRSFYLKQHGVSYIDSLAAFFSDRFVDLVAMLLLALVAGLVFPQYQWLVLVVSVLVLALLPVVHLKPFHASLEKLFSKITVKKLRLLGGSLVETLRSSAKLLRSGLLYAGIVIALFAWGAEGIAFYLILEMLNINTSLWLAVGIYSVSILAGALSFIPGGIGSTEAVMVLLLNLIGVDMPTAVAATVICRLATLWFAVLIGIMLLVFLEIRE